MGSWNQYIQFIRVLYCKLPTNGKQLPAFPLEAIPGTEPRPQRWEARVLPPWPPSGSDKRRTIINLRWPKGMSVNGVQGDCYLGTQFQIHYPSVDHILDQFNWLGPAAQIFKIDISRAFRHIRIDLGDIDLLGLKFEGKFFIDLSLPF